MRRRPLGETGLEISELGLGTWGLSGDGYAAVSEAEQDRVIERARALGITFFDTSASYAHGAMETRLGARLPDDGQTRIATRIGTDRDSLPPRKRFDVPFLCEQLQRSHERLKRTVLDIVLLHNPSLSALQRAEATSLLGEEQKQKRILAWGASVSSAEIARAAINRGARVIALPYNCFHSTELGLLEGEARAAGVGILAHSVLSYGLLCGHWSSDKDFPEGDHRAERWTRDELKRRIRQLDALRPLVGGHVLTLRAGALRFVLSNSLVASALLGPRSTLQLDQLVREAGKGPPYLTEDALRALAARLRQVGVEP
jgi:aryl-alcohol dehydrogenase-like predicted oxidoreductase